MRCMIFITNNEGSCYMGLYEDDREFIDDRNLLKIQCKR